MKIIKIYESEGGERLYSVSLSQEEYKIFSKREDWKNGEETEHQKKERKKLRNTLAASGGITGASIGAGIGVSGKTARKINEKTHNLMQNALEDSHKVVSRVESVANEINKRGFKDKQALEAWEKILEKAGHRIDVNRQGIERLGKTSSKMINKNILRQSAKGTAIGLGVGTGLGIMASKGIKKLNEETNRKRRGGKK